MGPQVVHRLRTRYLQGLNRGVWPFRRKQLATDQDVIELVFKLRARVTALEERADATEAAQERLRGRLYATGQHKPAPVVEPPRPLTKAEILNQHFMPGRPVKHT